MKWLRFVIPVLLLAIILFLVFSSHSPAYPSLAKQRAVLNERSAVMPVRILDSMQIIEDLKFLSSDTCEGRKPGTIGHQRAAERIISRMREAGLDSFDNSLIQPFDIYSKGNLVTAHNITGWIKGTKHPQQFIVISAHYDHVGRIGDSIYYGASDNASGTACLLAMAKYFKQHPPVYSLIFAAFDAEETGLKGANHFVEQLPGSLQLSSIVFNLNIDMIARNDDNEIVACGIHHYPSLKKIIEQVQPRTNTKILMGHDKGSGREDWTSLSDHYPFYLQKIPFLYFGTEDHIDYHKPTDTFFRIDLRNYLENCNMITLVALALNDSLYSLNVK